MRHVSAVAAAAIFGLGAWQAASAADLPRKAPPPAAVYVPVSTWTGCYIGGNAGAGWGSGEISTSAGTISGSSDSARFVGGGQIGCDWQTGAWVFGIRNMFDWADAERSGTIGSGAFNGFSVRLENDWLDLLTGRIGYSMQPNWLLYFQGGAAWRKNSLTIFNPAGAEVGSTQQNPHRLDGRRRLRIQVRAKLVGVRRVQSRGLRHHRRHHSRLASRSVQNRTSMRSCSA